MAMMAVPFILLTLAVVVLVAAIVRARTAQPMPDPFTPPPATQAGAAAFYYRIAQEQARLLERLVIADQGVPLFPEPTEREIAVQLIKGFYEGQPPKLTAQPPHYQVVKIAEPEAAYPSLSEAMRDPEFQYADMERLRRAAVLRHQYPTPWDPGARP